MFDITATLIHAPNRVASLMPLGEDHLISFYEYPKLFNLATGAVIHEWPHLPSGKQQSSIIWHLDPIPPIALDATNYRFAIAHESEITVVQCRKRK